MTKQSKTVAWQIDRDTYEILGGLVAAVLEKYPEDSSESRNALGVRSILDAVVDHHIAFE